MPISCSRRSWTPCTLGIDDRAMLVITHQPDSPLRLMDVAEPAPSPLPTRRWSRSLP